METLYYCTAAKLDVVNRRTKRRTNATQNQLISNPYIGSAY